MKVAIVGRPNVGKSSLFNALLRKKRAVVFNEPGTTVDLLTERADFGAGSFWLIDTLGIWEEKLIPADLYLWVVDGRSGLTPFDYEIAKKIYVSKIKTLLIVNKVDKELDEDPSLELKIEDKIFTSCAHRRNIESVKEWIAKNQKQKLEKPPFDISVAIIGRPNTGKSTLMNRVSRKRDSKTSPIQLTTRDPVTYEVKTKKGIIQFVDTAGIRRGQHHGIERFSVYLSLQSIKQAQLVWLMMDAREPFTDQDKRLLSELNFSGKPTLLVLNFWELLSESEKKNTLKSIRNYVGKLVQNFSIMPISAKTGFKVDKLLEETFELWEKTQKRTPTSALNKVLEKILRKNPPPLGEGNFNILYANQVKTSPPTFIFFVNRLQALPEHYKRYLRNELTSDLNLKNLPIKLFFRESR